jgi:CRISPR system Cascade subunit CasC
MQQPTPPPEARGIVARIAAELAAPGFPRGDLAALRRMDPEAPGRTPVLLRLLARHTADRLEYGADELRRWALLVHGMALMAPEHHRTTVPVGRALFGPGRAPLYAESRLARLLSARGRAFRAQVPRLARQLKAKDQALDWREFADLILAEGRNEARAEQSRERIAAAYYRTEARSAEDQDRAHEGRQAMTDPRFVQIHFLTSYPAALLNRDDAGLAKRLPFGGVTRTRISSQCLKRHWRTVKDEWALSRLSADAEHSIDLAQRSRRIFRTGVLGYLVEKEGYSEPEIRPIVQALKERFMEREAPEDEGKEKAEGDEDPLDTRQAFLLGDPEIEYLRMLVRRAAHSDDALRAMIMEKPKKKGQMTDFQKEQRKNFYDNMEAFSTAARLPRGLESALFGRMVTSDLIANTDATIHVAHAFTVHEEESESDYFTVVDDLKDRAGGDDAGSAGIFDMELTSGLYYGYVVIDVPGLVANLGRDAALAGRVVEHLIHLVATVSPGAKLGSTAPYGWAQLLLIEMGTRQPRTLANAFRDPVPLDRRGGTLEAAVAAMRQHLTRLDEAYGSAERRRFLAVEPGELPGAERSSLDKLAAWAKAAVANGTTVK